MATTQYIGSRYVPILADPVEWSNTKTYEPLTIVTHEGNSYTSRQFVPVGIDITNEEFWALTGNYNAQVEQYRRETAQAVENSREYTDAAVEQVNEWLTDAQDKYGNKPFAFDTVADMQAAYELLYVGAICHTNGFRASGDNGAAWYIISDNGTANGMDVLACGNLFANYIMTDGFATPEQFGAIGNGMHDDTAQVQMAIDKSNKVVLSNNYGINGVSIHSGLHLTGVKNATLTMLTPHWGIYSLEANHVSNVCIEYISMVGRNYYLNQYIDRTNLNRDVAICILNCDNLNISNCIFTKFGEIAIRVLGSNIFIKNNNIMTDVDYSISGANEPNYSFGVSINGDNFNISGNSIVGYIQGIISGLILNNTLIDKNYISQRVQHGMYIEGGNNVIISNNIIDSDEAAICGIKVQSDGTGEQMRNFTITNNIIATGIVGQGILVTGLTAYHSYIEDVLISNNYIYRAGRGIECSFVYDLTISGNVIDASEQRNNYGILIGNLWNDVAAQNTTVIKDNRIKAHACLYMRPSELSSAIYILDLQNNTFEFVAHESMTGIPFAVSVTTINTLYALGNIIKAISGGNNNSGFHFNCSNIPNIAIMSNNINGFSSDFRISGTLTEQQRNKIQYNLYDTAIGL